jgi:hypothetical protein
LVTSTSYYKFFSPFSFISIKVGSKLFGLQILLAKNVYKNEPTEHDPEKIPEINPFLLGYYS